MCPSPEPQKIQFFTYSTSDLAKCRQPLPSGKHALRQRTSTTGYIMHSTQHV